MDEIGFDLMDLLDIFLVAMIIYYCYRFMKESRSINVFVGILVFIISATLSLLVYNRSSAVTKEDQFQ